MTPPPTVLLRLMGMQIVQDHVNLAAGILGDDLVHEIQQLPRRPARDGRNPPPGGNILVHFARLLPRMPITTTGANLDSGRRIGFNAGAHCRSIPGA